MLQYSFSPHKRNDTATSEPHKVDMLSNLDAKREPYNFHRKTRKTWTECKKMANKNSKDIKKIGSDVDGMAKCSARGL